MALAPHMVINNGHICMRSTNPKHIFYKYPSLHGVLPVSSINTAMKLGYAQGAVYNNTQIDDVHGLATRITDDTSSSWVDMPPATATAEAYKWCLVGLYSFGSNPLMSPTEYANHANQYYVAYTRLATTIRLQQLWDFADPARRMDSTVADWNNLPVNVSMVIRCYDYGVGLGTYQGQYNPAQGHQIYLDGLTGWPMGLIGQIRTTFPTNPSGWTDLMHFQGRAGAVTEPGGAGYTWWDPLPPGAAAPAGWWNRGSFWDNRGTPSPMVWTPGATNNFRLTSSAHLYMSLTIRANQRMFPSNRVHCAAYAGDFEIEYHVTPA